MRAIRNVVLAVCTTCGRTMPQVLMHPRRSDSRMVCNDSQRCGEWRDAHPDHTNGQTIAPPRRHSRLVPPVDMSASNERQIRR